MSEPFRIGGQPWAQTGTDSLGVPTFSPYTFRKDGWPMCPKCGEDELWTSANSNKLEDHFAREFRCYYCSWHGELLPRSEA